MKTILMTAYAVNPYKGSEDGMGWNFICQAARQNRVIAVTRENNELAIRKYMLDHPEPYNQNIQFLYFDLPYWARFWKRGPKGALLYYYLWQLFLPAFIRKSSKSFDIAHNLNFHNDWTPSRLWTLGKPVVWGPIGHHPVIPHEFVLGPYGTRSYFADRLRWYTKSFIWKFDPLLRSTVKHANCIIAMNKSVERVLPLQHKKVFIIPSVGSEPVQNVINKKHIRFQVLSIGRFTELKGFDVTIKSFARFYNKLTAEEKKQTGLTLIGKGPTKELLQELAHKEGISAAVTFVDWVDRERLTQFYNEASVFLFPSHEGAGMVISEALSFGLPVICFDNCGPGEFINDQCGIKISYGTYNHTVKKFAHSLYQLFQNKTILERLSEGALSRFRHHFEWNSKGWQLQKVYDSIETKSNIIKQSKPKNKVVCVHLLNDYSGSPLVFSEAIKGLAKSGHQIDLYTSGQSQGFLTGLPVQDNTFWYRFYKNKYLRLTAFMISQMVLFLKLLKYWRQPIDIYINTILPFGAALAGKVMNKKVIYHLHETSINPPRFKKMLQLIAESTANTAIYVSHYLMKKEPLRGVTSSVVHNALPDEFVNKASSYRLHKIPGHGPFCVLMLCSLKTYKGVNDFVELAERMPHIQFELVLNSSQIYIDRFFASKKLPDNLQTYAATDNVHPFYERANLVLNLSHPDQWIETFGMTILEAMCYGIPVIAPPVGGVTELVMPNINGFLKDVRSKHDLRNTIHQIYADPILCKRLSEQALITSEKFKSDIMQQKVCEIIEKPVSKE